MPTIREAKIRTGAYALTSIEVENVTGKTALELAEAMKQRVMDFDAKRPLIGLVGKKGSGKSTVASILCRNFGYREEAFAYALKREMFETFGDALMQKIVNDSGYSRVFTTGNFSAWLNFIDVHKNDAPDTKFGWVRPMLQFWGTEYRRNLCGDNYWIDQLTPKLGPAVVVSDVRFANEVDAIRKAGGVVWAVLRQTASSPTDAHSSEAGQDTITPDFWCTNFRDLDYLAQVQVPKMMRFTLERY